MAYYFTIKEKNGYKLLDISQTEQFQRLSKFKNNSYSLEEIDNFTSQFDSEISLKIVLYKAGIITAQDIKKEISIRMKNNGILTKVMYDPVYKETRKYLDDFYLRGKLLELQSDKIFLNKLLNHYRRHYKQENIAKIRAAIGEYSDSEINIYEALSSLFADIVYDSDYRTGEVKLKYKSLHDLAMFIYNYLYEKDKSKVEIESNKIGKMQQLNILKQSISPPVKKRILKKREELEGQISFFD